MPISSPRFMALKPVPTDSAMTLMVYPCGKDASIHNVHCLVDAKTVPEGNSDATGSITARIADLWNSTFSGPFSWSEYNLVPLWVPYEVVLTFTPKAGAEPRTPNTEAEWDTLYRRLVFEFGIDGNEYYGANPDGASSTYDVVQNVWRRTRTAADVIDGEGNAPVDEPLLQPATSASYGPRGIIRLASYERWLSGGQAITAFKRIPILNTILNNLGVNEVVFEDKLTIDLNVNMGHGFLIIGVVRYAVPDTDASGYAASMAGGTSTFSDGIVTTTYDAAAAARNQAMNTWMTGDTQRINHLIKLDTTAVGDYLRSLIFGGDLNIHADPTAASFAGALFGTGKPSMPRNTIMFGLKGHMTIGSPYSLIAQV